MGVLAVGVIGALIGGALTYTSSTERDALRQKSNRVCTALRELSIIRAPSDLSSPTFSEQVDSLIEYALDVSEISIDC